jgi:acetoacetate decarboxylase
MKPDPSKYYRMPLIMGPLFERGHKCFYPQVEAVAFQYHTSPEAIAALLPECYRPAKDPLVTVHFSENNGADFMAGRGYRMAAFQVAACFDGEEDHLEGDYCLAFFEDQTWPIIGGREDIGVPKLYADISPLKKLPGGHIRCEASLWGHFLFSLEIPPMNAQTGLVRSVATKRINSRPWLGYKYIPSLEGPPDVQYPLIIYIESKLEKLWLGKSASLRFGKVQFDEVAFAKPLIEALATLTVIEPVQALHFQGSSVDRYDIVRRLK